MSQVDNLSIIQTMEDEKTAKRPREEMKEVEEEPELKLNDDFKFNILACLQDDDLITQTEQIKSYYFEWRLKNHKAIERKDKIDNFNKQDEDPHEGEESDEYYDAIRWGWNLRIFYSNKEHFEDALISELIFETQNLNLVH